MGPDDATPQLGKRRKDWQFIKTAYIVKGWTAQQCAEHFGLDVTTVKKRASKENWTAERHQNTTNGEKVATDLIRSGVQQITQSHVAATEQALAISQKLGDKISATLDAITIVADLEKKNTDNGANVVLGLRALRSITETFVRFTEGQAKVIGANRESRGLKNGMASDSLDSSRLKKIEIVVAPEPESETA